jgi:hypothetical protein
MVLSFSGLPSMKPVEKPPQGIAPDNSEQGEPQSPLDTLAEVHVDLVHAHQEHLERQRQQNANGDANQRFR